MMFKPNTPLPTVSGLVGRVIVVICKMAASAAAFILASALASSQGHADPAEWSVFRTRFITSDGRVVDNGQGGISHSEGQGIGLFLAVTYDDRQTFDRVLGWTINHLTRPNDHLMAWRWRPDSSPHVQDWNNATDGDLTIAWALAQAAQRWHVVEYERRASLIARDIMARCITSQGGHVLLLPGAFGFQHEDGVVINPSYYIFRALRAMAALAPDLRWATVEADGLELLRHARFGPFGLPPDWLLIQPDGTLRPAPGWPARFSYDAARIPLNLASAHLREPALTAALSMWRAPGLPVKGPAWIGLESPVTASFQMGLGFRAIIIVGDAEAKGIRPGRFPTISGTYDYYQAALALMAQATGSMPDIDPATPAASLPIAAISLPSTSPDMTTQTTALARLQAVIGKSFGAIIPSAEAAPAYPKAVHVAAAWLGQQQVDVPARMRAAPNPLRTAP